jgi:surface polysaccharide O-acyltransferase-like enzyme
MIEMPTRSSLKPGKAMNRLPGVDALKTVAAIAVVLIHTHPFSDFEGALHFVAAIIDQAARFALPTFFILSGYFLGQRVANGMPEYVAFKISMLRVVAVLLFWSAFFLVWPSELSSVPEHGYLRVIYWHAAKLFSDPWTVLLKSTKYHLWFLVSLGLSLVFLLAMHRFISLRLTLWVGLGIFLLSLLGGPYAILETGVYLNAWVAKALTPLVNVFFVAFGYWLSFSRMRLSSGACIAAAIFGFALSLVEIGFLHVIHLIPLESIGHLFGTSIAAVALCMLVLPTDAKPEIRMPSRLVKSLAVVGPLTLGIYVCHPLFIDLYRPLYMWVPSLVWQFLFPLMVFVSAMLLTLGMARVPMLRHYVI